MEQMFQKVKLWTGTKASLIIIFFFFQILISKSNSSEVDEVNMRPTNIRN